MIFFLLLALMSTSALAIEERHVIVQGHCETKVDPDRAMVTFTAENQSRDQKEAVHKTNDQINRLKEKIKAKNLANLELKNTGYNVYPVREYEKDHFVDKGTRASLTLEVTTSDIPRVGEIMVEASQIGIQNIGALQTFLSIETSRSEYLKCLDIAADDASKKAEQLGKKLGFKVGKVLALNETPSTTLPEPRYPQMRTMMKGASMEMAATNIEPGKQLFSTTIQVTFGIK